MCGVRTREREKEKMKGFGRKKKHTFILGSDSTVVALARLWHKHNLLNTKKMMAATVHRKTVTPIPH